ncbi:conserved hypothetical protein [Trichinella spiralis]|uniref:hypothetical protein n=1 Tax=Trichinella spiralis TaxID=6334 RepID=UPI0001EFB6C0|nr:conserved hypothetical protein [Trichinella spiralis]
MNFRRFEQQQQRSSVIGNDCCRRLCVSRDGRSTELSLLLLLLLVLVLCFSVWFASFVVQLPLNKLNLACLVGCLARPAQNFPPTKLSLTSIHYNDQKNSSCVCIARLIPFHLENVKSVTSVGKMHFTGLQVFSFLLLLAGTGLVIASVATGYWSYESSGLKAGNLDAYEKRRGLWEKCHRFFGISGILGDKAQDGYRCVNRFKALLEQVQQGELTWKDVEVQCESTWEIAVLALMSISALISVMSLIFSPCCCKRCGCCLTFWVLIAALCTISGVGLYAYEATAVQDKAVPDLNELISGKVTFGWSFWLAVAGGLCQIFSTVGFGVSRARHQPYSHLVYLKKSYVSFLFRRVFFSFYTVPPHWSTALNHVESASFEKPSKLKKEDEISQLFN